MRQLAVIVALLLPWALLSVADHLLRRDR